MTKQHYLTHFCTESVALKTHIYLQSIANNNNRNMLARIRKPAPHWLLHSSQSGARLLFTQMADTECLRNKQARSWFARLGSQSGAGLLHDLQYCVLHDCKIKKITITIIKKIGSRSWLLNARHHHHQKKSDDKSKVLKISSPEGKCSIRRSPNFWVASIRTKHFCKNLNRVE